MLALYRIYRPSLFADVTGQEHVTSTIQNQIHSGSVSHAYVFTGPRGIGKTTVARLLAKAVNCEQPNGSEPCNQCTACVSVAEGKAMDVFEIDAASNTDVENVRENIIRSVRFAPTQLKKKVYIIDEVHMLSTSAFNALLKTLEEPPEHALFILATTEIHKVPATILSRCQRFDFKKISKEAMVARLQEIVRKEGRSVEESVLQAIARHSGGSERDAESLLGQVLALDEGEITFDIASLVLPATTDVLVASFIDLLIQKETAATVSLLNQYLEQGVDLSHFLDDVISVLREHLLKEVIDVHAGDRVAFYRKAIELFLAARRHVRTDEIPQLPAELAIFQLCLPALSPPLLRGEHEGGLEKNDHFPKQGVGSVKGKKISQEETKVPEKETPHVTLEPIVETETTVPVLEMAEAFEVSTEDSPLLTTHHAPLITSETVFDSVPVIGIDEVKQKWPEVFEQIQECNASLPLFLQSCEVNGVGGGVVELAFEYDLYVQTVNKEKNRRLVESILERVLGKTVRIRAVLAKAKQTDEVVSSLADAFGGSVV